MNESQLAAHIARLATEVGRQEQALYTNPVRVRRLTRPAYNPTIDQCATGNCQKQPLGTVLGEERPWWFWLAVGAGVGGLLYAISRSGFSMNPRDDESLVAQRAAAIAVQANIPTILWGAPGIGKTSWLEALGESMKCKVFTVIGSTRDPADIAGMMRRDGTVTPPVWAKEIRIRSLAGQRSVLFLDEFSSMMPMVHAALLRVVQNKIAGECDFDPKRYIAGYKIVGDKKTPIWKTTKLRGNAVHVVCAANPKSMGAHSIDLPAPAANRMLHIDWPIPSAADWAEGIMHGFRLPSLDSLPLNWKSTKDARGARKDVAAFLAHMTTDLLDVPEDAEAMGLSWPSPRSWELTADALGAARVIGANRSVELKLVEGCVGLMVAGRFFDWLGSSKKWSDTVRPDLTKILEGKLQLKKLSGFDKLDRVYVMGREVFADFLDEPSIKKWNRSWKFIEDATELSEKVTSGEVTDVSKDFQVAPLAVLASELLDALNDPAYAKVLKGAKLPDEALLEKLEYENIRVRRPQ